MFLVKDVDILVRCEEEMRMCKVCWRESAVDRLEKRMQKVAKGREVRGKKIK